MNIPQINNSNTLKNQASSPEIMNGSEAFRKFDEQFNVVQQEMTLFSTGDSKVDKNSNHREQVEANRKEDADTATEDSLTAAQSFLTQSHEAKSRQSANMVREGIQLKSNEKTNFENGRVQNNILDEKLSVDKARYQTPTIQTEETPATVASSFSEVIAKESDNSLKNKLNMLSEANENAENGKTTKADPSKVTKPVEAMQNQQLEKNMTNNLQRTETKGQENTKAPVQMTAAAIAGKVKTENLTQMTKSSSVESFQSIQEATESKASPKAETLSKTNKATETQQRFEAANVKEVVGNIRIMLNTDKNEMVMRLNPEHLGKLEIKLKKDGEAMSASMKVESLEAKTLIESQLSQLRENLQNQGVLISEFKVFLNEDVATKPTLKFSDPGVKQNKPEGSGTRYASTNNGMGMTSQSGINPSTANKTAVNFYA